jgi:hypothetical protein
MTELGRFGVTVSSGEILLSASVTPLHRNLLASYRMSAHRGEDGVRQLIMRDLRNFLDLGALDPASDLLIVLALFTREAKRCDRRLTLATCRQRDAITLQHWRGGHMRYAAGKGKAPQFGPEALAGQIEGCEDGETDSPC